MGFNGFGGAARRYIWLRDRSCASKQTFDTEHDALRHARRMLKLKGWKMRTYRCAFCPRWHLTRST